MSRPDHRLLLVHAHPDDESINNGATMARYAAEGARVTLVTCTLGEEGEIHVPEIANHVPALKISWNDKVKATPNDIRDALWRDLGLGIQSGETGLGESVPLGEIAEGLVGRNDVL